MIYKKNTQDKITDAGNLIEEIKDEELEAYVREIVFEKHSISSNWEERNPGITPEILLHKYSKDIVLRFKLFKIDERIKENHNKIENAETEEDALQFMTANKELENEKKRLREEFSEIEIG